MSKIESLTQKTFKGFFWSAGGKIVNATSQILVLVLLARLISPASFGLVQASLIVVGFAKIFSKLGIGAALVQRENLNKKHIQTGFTVSLLIGIIMALIIYLSSDSIAAFFRFSKLPLLLKYISLIFIFEAYTSVSRAILQREMRFKELSIIEMFSYIFGYVLFGIIFALLGFDYWALIIAIFSQEIIKVIFYAFLKKHSLKIFFGKKEFKELMYFGGGQTLAVLFNKIGNQGDNIITGRYLGDVSLGLYSKAYGLMVMPYSLIADAVDSSLYPAMCHVQNERHRLLRSFKKAIKVLAVLSLPIMGLFLFYSQNIVFFLLGNEWIDASVPLAILSLTFLFRVASRISDILVRATGEVYKRAWRRLIYAGLILFGTFVGQKFGGLEGVACGVVFASFINFGLMATLTFSILKIGWKDYLSFYKEGIIILAIFSFFLFCFKAILISITSSNVLVLFGGGGLGFLASIFVIFYFRSFLLYDIKDYLYIIFKKLKLNEIVAYINKKR